MKYYIKLYKVTIGNIRRKYGQKQYSSEDFNRLLFSYWLENQNKDRVFKKYISWSYLKYCTFKVSGYKINTKKSVAFLYTNNKRSEREIKVTIPFIITLKRIKYLGINLHERAKGLYSEKYKTLVKEIEDDTNR